MNASAFFCRDLLEWVATNPLTSPFVPQVPRDEEGEPLYDEFICQDCSVPCSFLTLYPASIWAPSRAQAPVRSEASDEGSRVNDAFQDENSVEEKNVGPECVLGVNLDETAQSAEKKPMFLSKKWRNALCRCRACSEFYAKKGIDYLIDREDSLEEYENIAKRKRQEKMQEQEGAELNFLNTLNHVQKIEILNGIADMKNELQSFMVFSLCSALLQFMPSGHSVI